MIDTHSHIYAEEFTDDVEEVIQRAKSVGVEKILLPNINPQTIQPMLSLCRRHPGFLYPMLGLHPTDLTSDYQSQLHTLESQLSLGHPYIAIGEVGLDFYWSSDFKEEQTECFRRQVELAIEFDLPLVIHTRSAWDEMLTILEEYKGRVRGILHAFGESVEVFERIERLGGFVVGIGGVVTYKKSPLLESVPHIPLSMMVVETDSPYLSPVPFRGKRNEPKNLVYICEQIARLKGCTAEEVAEATTRNARTIFGI